MSIYRLIYTNIGLSKIQNAELSGDFVDIKEFAVGDGVINDLQPSMTGLLNEKYRTDINHISTVDGVTNFDLVIPAEIGGFYIREVALYDVVGDCICIGTVPVTYKVNPDDGASKAVHIRVSTATNNVDTIELGYDNSYVFATILYVDDHIYRETNAHHYTAIGDLGNIYDLLIGVGIGGIPAEQLGTLDDFLNGLGSGGSGGTPPTDIGTLDDFLNALE